MHSSLARLRRMLPIIIAVAATAGLAAPLAARAGDDPGIGVARLSFIQGSVVVQRGDAEAPTDAVANAPLLGADYVTTGAGARAEVQLDGRSAIRLAENVQMRFTHLDAGNRDVQLAQGTIEVRAVGGGDPRIDVDTPSVTVRPVQPGSYRITVDAGGRTLVTVRAGRADVLTPQGTRALDPGSTLLAQGPATSPSIAAVALVGLDAFDAFNVQRDVRLESALAATQPYVNQYMPGVDDLNAYGRWVNDGTYGTVWVPAGVAADWVPYRDGRWVWEDGFGWTWLGYEPWGWAPYHYGRWYHSRLYGWAWWPPAPVIVQPWRPALVAFFGFGGGSAFSLGFGNIGWVPLAPSEPFCPWWGRGAGPTIVNNVTIVNNTTYTGFGQFGRHFRNALAGGATAVSHERFLLGRFDHPIAVTAAQAGTVHVARGSLPVVPTAAHLRYGERAAAGTDVAAHAAFRRGFAGSGGVAPRILFERQQAAIVTGLHATAGSETPATATWARFSTARGSVEVIDGASGRVTTAPARSHTAVVSDPWRRFDAGTTTSVRAGGASTAPLPRYVRAPAEPHILRTESVRRVPVERAAPAPAERPRSTPRTRSLRPEPAARHQ